MNEEEDLCMFSCAAANEIHCWKCLTTASTREYLQSVARARDDNNGMTRKEIISLISEIVNTAFSRIRPQHPPKSNWRFNLPLLAKFKIIIADHIHPVNRKTGQSFESM